MTASTPIRIGGKLYACAEQAELELGLSAGHIEHVLEHDIEQRILGKPVQIVHRRAGYAPGPLLRNLVTHRLGTYSGGPI